MPSHPWALSVRCLRLFLSTLYFLVESYSTPKRIKMQEFFEKNLIFLDLSISKIKGAGENWKKKVMTKSEQSSIILVANG